VTGVLLIVMGLAALAVVLYPDRGASDGAPSVSLAATAAGERFSDAAPGARVERRTIRSRLLSRTLPYQVFLPPGYDDASPHRYPVLYMLHGLGGDYTEWVGYRLFEAAEAMINDHEIPPMLIVLPEGQDSYWMDHADNGPPWGAYVAEEIVGEIDARYRTLADRGHRAIGGNSMGAHGALQLSLNYPEVFGVVGAHSPTFRRHDTMPPYAGDQAYFESHDPVTLVQRRPQTARRLRLWIDIGDADYWTSTAEAFHQQLAGLDIPHSFTIHAGGHEDAYWTANVTEYLRFYGEAMNE